MCMCEGKIGSISEIRTHENNFYFFCFPPRCCRCCLAIVTADTLEHGTVTGKTFLFCVFVIVYSKRTGYPRARATSLP